jgi:hypothetical protein
LVRGVGLAHGDLAPIKVRVIHFVNGGCHRIAVLWVEGDKAEPLGFSGLTVHNHLPTRQPEPEARAVYRRLCLDKRYGTRDHGSVACASILPSIGVDNLKDFAHLRLSDTPETAECFIKTGIVYVPRKTTDKDFVYLVLLIHGANVLGVTN